MEIVVRGRNVEVPEHFRQHVEDKVGQLERFDAKLIRIDVELLHEKNPRQSSNCQRVELTLRGKGPVARAEACAQDFYAALELALAKVENRLRRAADRRRVHHGRRTPASVRLEGAPAELVEPVPDEAVSADPAGAELDDHLPGQVVREKMHPAEPMTVDQALYEMELVGHDFFLFLCAKTGQPSVVYRRHAFDYGLIRLGADAPAGAVQANTTAAAPEPAVV